MHRSPEERHEPVAAKFVEVAPELKDSVDHMGEVTVENVYGVVRIEALGQRRESTQVAEENGDLALFPAQLQMTSGIGNDLGGYYLGYIPAEQRAEQAALCFNVIMERLDPEQRLDPGQELLFVKRLGQKVVGPCFDAADTVAFVAEGRQHHDREQTGGLISADTL